MRVPSPSRSGLVSIMSWLCTFGTGDGPPNYVIGSKDLVFSTHLTFNESVSSITNGQLEQMLKDAWKELSVDAQQYGYGSSRWPKVVTFFAFGNEIILSSSQQGPSFAYEYVASPVKESLALCMAVWKDQTGEEKTHFRDASCGEIMCAHQYYQVHTTPLKEANVRSLTGFYQKKIKNLQFIPECGTNEKVDWGCKLFVAQNNIDYLALDTVVEAYDLNTLAGGISNKEQIRMC